MHFKKGFWIKNSCLSTYWPLLETTGSDSKCVHTLSHDIQASFSSVAHLGPDPVLHGSCRFAYVLLLWSWSFIQASCMLLSICQLSLKRMKMKQGPVYKSSSSSWLGADWEQNSWQLEHSNFRSVAWDPGRPPNQRTYLDRIGRKLGGNGQSVMGHMGRTSV